MNQTTNIASANMTLLRAELEAWAGFQPHYVKASPYLSQLPLLAWLTAALKPRQIIALGLGMGTGYFTLCQAVSEAHVTAEVYGIDHWTDPQGMPQIPDALQAENAARYAGFSRLINGMPRHALDIFDPEDVDLLVVDMAPDAEIAALLCDGWAASMSDHGVIVVKDAQTAQALSQRWPSLTVDGLTVALIGRALPAELLALARLPQAEIGRLLAPLLNAGKAFEAARSVTHSLQLEDLLAREAALEAALAQRDVALAALQNTLGGGSEALQTEITQLEDAIARRDFALAGKVDEIQILQSELDTQRARNEERIAELVVLTKIAEAHRLAAETLEKTHAKVLTEQVQKDEKIVRLYAERREARAQTKQALAEVAKLETRLLEQQEAFALQLEQSQLDLKAQLEEGFAAASSKTEEKIQRLYAERREARQQAAAAQKQVASQGAELAKLRSLIAQQGEALEQARAAARQFEGQWAEHRLQLEQKHAGLATEHETLRKRLEAAEQQKNALTLDLQDARNEVFALRNSTSWKVTSPIRKVKTVTFSNRKSMQAGE